MGPGHPLRDWLLKAGATDGDLAWFREHPCPPDLLGFNHYVTSERFLDHRIELYPQRCHGGNGRQAYADIEAVRICEPAGLGRLLREAWERYRIPIALTEVQVAGMREDQLAWFREAWETAVALRLEGVDAQAAWVVRLRFFAGLNERSVAEALGVSERTVRRDWVFARGWLRDAIERGEGGPAGSETALERR